MIGILSAMIAYTMMGSATSGWMIYAAGIFAALAGLYGPSLNNMMSSRISESEQGELQGAIGAAQGLAMMIGPFLMAGAFWYCGDADLRTENGLIGFPQNVIEITQHVISSNPLSYIPGAPFLVAALLSALALVAFVFATNKEDRDRRFEAKDDVVEVEGEVDAEDD